MAEFLKKAFQDMKESAMAQHEVDKAQFNAVKAESKAQWEEAKAMRDPKKRKAMMQAERDEQIAEANKRAASQARMLCHIANAHVFTNTRQEYFPL